MYILYFLRASWSDAALLILAKQIQLLQELREQGIDANTLPYCTSLNMKNK